MAKVTWAGENGGPDFVEQFGITFPKGKAIEVADDNRNIGKFVGNPAFEVIDYTPPAEKPATKGEPASKVAK